VYVKIPITNTLGQSCAPLVHRLARHGVRVNVTAIMTVDQVDSVIPALKNGPPSFVSMLAGRIADAGCDPLPSICGALTRLRNHPHIELIWASPRELFNVIQADQIGCHIISVSHDLLAKLPLLGRDLTEFSLDSVKMFHADARSAGFTLA
jgi:transaldolase